MRLPRSGSLGDGRLSLGLSPPMTLALPRPLSESVCRSVWIGQRPPLGSLQLSGVCRAAGYVFLVSPSSPPYLQEARRPPRPLSSPSSPSAPAAPPAPSLKQPPPPSALAWGEGAFLLGARRLLQASILFFCFDFFPSSIHSKNSPPPSPPRASRER